MTLTLGALLRQDMTPVGLGAFEAATTGFAKAFGCSAIGLQLWHLSSPLGFCYVESSLKCRRNVCRSNYNLLFLGGKHHDHLLTFHLWKLLDHAIKF